MARGDVVVSLWQPVDENQLTEETKLNRRTGKNVDSVSVPKNTRKDTHKSRKPMFLQLDTKKYLKNFSKDLSGKSQVKVLKMELQALEALFSSQN